MTAKADDLLLSWSQECSYYFKISRPRGSGGQALIALAGENTDSMLSITIHESGQLLRWSLGGGDNITVLGPEVIRKVIAKQ
jgi:hypothetical protein